MEDITDFATLLFQTTSILIWVSVLILPISLSYPSSN